MSNNELTWYLVYFSGAVITWCAIVFLVIKMVTLRGTYSRYRNLLSSGLLICLCTTIAATYLNYGLSSFQLDLAKLQRNNTLLIEKHPDETSEQQARKSWLKTVDSVDAPLLYQEVKLHLTAMVEPLYLMITIVGAGLGSTFLGMAVIEKLPRSNKSYSEFHTSYSFYEYKINYNSSTKIKDESL
ncbi:hypothetical protein ACGDLY_013475 [Vibrio campbellii]